MLSCQMTDTQVLPFYGEFVEINQHQTGIGLGGDGERLGKIYAENHQLFLSSVAKRNDETALFSNEDLNQIMKECRDYESYVDWFICFARKPLLQDDDGGDDNEEILVSSMAQSSLDSIYEFVDGFDDETSIIHQ